MFVGSYLSTSSDTDGSHALKHAMFQHQSHKMLKSAVQIPQ